MADERVDKGWQAKGLEGYSIGAILGTLRHYGVAVDEAGFKEAAARDFPFTIAVGWHEEWKGTGQFSTFPAAAADELWRRWCPGQVTPGDVALALTKLLTALDGALAGAPDDGARETRFKVVENYVATLPGEPERRRRFLDELSGTLDEWLNAVDRLAEALSRKGHVDLATRFSAIEEALFPIRAGVAGATVLAGQGDVDGAARALLAVATDAARDGFNRVAALDALMELERHEEARDAAASLLAWARASKDFDVGEAVTTYVVRLFDERPDLEGLGALRAQLEAMASALSPSGGVD